MLERLFVVGFFVFVFIIMYVTFSQACQHVYMHVGMYVLCAAFTTVRPVIVCQIKLTKWCFNNHQNRYILTAGAEDGLTTSAKSSIQTGAQCEVSRTI